MGALAALLRGCALLIGIYFLGTGAYGALMGARIHRAKAENFLLSFGASLIGRDQVEGYVIRKLGLPPFLTDSPAFWIGLRFTE